MRMSLDNGTYKMPDTCTTYLSCTIKNVVMDEDSEDQGNEISLVEFSLMGEIRRYGIFVDFTID